MHKFAVAQGMSVQNTNCSVSSPAQVFIGAPEAFGEAGGQIASQELNVGFQTFVTILFAA